LAARNEMSSGLGRVKARLSWLVLGVAACAGEGAEEARLDESAQAIIYGNDDRLEVYQHPDPILRGLAQSSAVALIPRNRFGRAANGDFVLYTQSLAGAFNVCADQRFADELAAADCSGVLIDDDLVLTAAHCFQSDQACERYSFVFDYWYRDVGDLEPFGWGDIYSCRRVVSRTLSVRTAVPRIDYAVVQLDRKPLGRTPVALRMTPLNEGDSVATIGCVSGLPAKIDSGGRVLDSRSPDLDYFQLDSDTFQGSSGSGVFDRSGRLAGVLVRGGEDYRDIPDGACQVPNVVTELGVDDGGLPLKLAADGGMLTVDGEEATYVARVVEGVCGTGWPSPRLCSTSARCGDGICSVAETRTDCPADCACMSGECLDGGSYVAAPAGSLGLEKARPVEDSGCAVSLLPRSRVRGGASTAHDQAGALVPSLWLVATLWWRRRHGGRGRSGRRPTAA
jgi:hypothetical protein